MENVAKKTLRVGSHAVSTINFDSWNAQPVSQANSKTRKTKVVKEPTHKLFEQCASVIDDPFWIEKFKMFALGKFPRCFSYANNQLMYKKTNKCVTADVPSDPYSAVQVCIAFFHNNASMYSPVDQQRMLAHEESLKMNYVPIKWDNINKRVQECLIYYFLDEQEEKLNLTKKEVDNLKNIIIYGINSKYFTKTNIEIENSRIIKIDGLLWNPNTRKWTIDQSLQPSVSRSYSRSKTESTSVKEGVPQYAVRWFKYTEHLDRKIHRINKIKNGASNVTTITNNNNSKRLGFNINSTQLTQGTVPSHATSTVVTTDVDDDETDV